MRCVFKFSVNMNKATWTKVWLAGTCFLLWLMVMLGGATRLTHAGLSIVEWRPLTGIFPPLNYKDWQHLFQLYQQYPEYQSVFPTMSLNEFKFIFWMEYTHRLLGRLIGIFFAVPMISLWRDLPFSLRSRGLVALALGGIQGIVGWYMVKSGLINDPRVSPYRLTLHLGLAFFLYGWVLWMLLDSLSGKKAEKVKGSWQAGSLLIFMGQLLTMIYGGLVAGHHAGLIYNTFPLMEGEWLPQEWDFYSPVWINFFKNEALVQWLHRVLAVVSWLSLIGYWFFGRLKRKTQHLTHWLIATTVQGILGITTLLYQVPVSLGVLHQGWAIVVLTTALITLHPRRDAVL